VTPTRHYLEFDSGVYDTRAVYAAVREHVGKIPIDKVSPMTSKLWLVELLEPYKEDT
jgi:hypothetical protein